MKRLEKQKNTPNPKLNPQLSEGSIGGVKVCIPIRTDKVYVLLGSDRRLA